MIFLCLFISIYIFSVLFFFFWPHYTACRITVPWPGTIRGPSATQWSPNHRTSREFPSLYISGAHRTGSCHGLPSKIGFLSQMFGVQNIFSHRNDGNLVVRLKLFKVDWDDPLKPFKNSVVEHMVLLQFSSGFFAKCSFPDLCEHPGSL